MTNEITLAKPKVDLIATEIMPLDQNPAAVYLAGLGNDRSRATQGDALKIIARMLTGSPNISAVRWGKLRFQHTAAIRSKLAESYSPASANRMLCALRGTLKAAWRLGQMTDEQRARACDLEPIKGKTLPTGRALSSGEIDALIIACEDDPTPAGARDAALIACMYPGGLRRDEVAKLDYEDYDPETGELKVKHAKGNKQRIAHLSNGAIRAMGDWLEVRGDDPGPLMHPINKGGRILHSRMSNQAVYIALLKRAELAGVSNVTPHDLRRSFITDLLEAGADISIVAAMAGHESTNTTAKYDRRPEAAKAKAAGLLHLPYHGRHK